MSGQFFEDLNGNGLYEPAGGEAPLPDRIAYLDLNGNGVLDGIDGAHVVESDAFADRAALTDVHPGVTLQTTGADNQPVPLFTVTANSGRTATTNLASTGEMVFGHANVPYWNDIRRLRMDFTTPVASVGIDFTGSSVFEDEVGRLEVYDANDQLLEAYTTSGLRAEQSETMQIDRSGADIAYAVAWTSEGEFGRLDRLTFGDPAGQVEPTTTTDSNGAYSFSDLSPESYHVRQVVPGDWKATSPADAPTPDGGVLLDIPNRRDHVYDAVRNVHYITTGAGAVERFDAVTGQLLAPWSIGNALGSADISLDGQFLYVGEQEPAGEEGVVYKIDLNTGAATELTFDRGDVEGGVHDLAVAANGKALVTTAYQGSGSTPLRELDLATDTFSVRRSIAGETRLSRSADGERLLVTETTSSSGVFYLYESASDEFVQSFTTSTFLAGNAVLNGDGSLFALEGWGVGLSVLDPELTNVEILPHLRGGLAFDPQRDVLYAGDHQHDEIVAFDTNNFQELFRMPLGEEQTALGNRTYYPLRVSSDGRYLFLSTPSGVRVYHLGATSHHVSLGPDQSLANLDFGSRLDNAPPSAADDSYAVLRNEALTVNGPGVLANDSDLDGDSLTAAIESPPAHGSLQLLENGEFTYTPSAGFAGADEFTYQVSDGNGQSDTATVQITIAAPASVEGQVFLDLDGDGAFNPQTGEIGVVEREVYLDLNQNGSADAGEPSVLTDGDGRYRFTGLLPGHYAVRLVAQDNWSITSPAPAPPPAESVLLGDDTRRDHRFTSTGGTLYIANAEGNVEAYSTGGGQLVDWWDVGVSLTGFDLTLDEDFLYVGEGQSGVTQNFVRKLDLRSGDVTNLRFVREGREAGVTDVAMTSNNTAFVTSGFRGSGTNPLREIDLANDSFSKRTDFGFMGHVHQETQISRSQDRSLLYLMEPNASNGPTLAYDADADVFERLNLDSSVGGNSAVNRDGSLIAAEAFNYGLRVLNADLEEVAELPHLRGGLAFDPVRDILYVGDVDTDEIVAYDTAAFDELYRFPIGEDQEWGGNRLYYPMRVSPGGRYLSLSTPSGVRLYTLGSAGARDTLVTPGGSQSGVDFGLQVEGPAAPHAGNDAYAVPAGETFVIDRANGALANDVDYNFDPLTADLVEAPDHGSLQFNADGSFTYEPDSAFVGTDQFSYEVSDGQDGTALATVTLNVAPVNQAPDLGDDYFVVNAARGAVALPVLLNDSDAETFVAADSVQVVEGPESGAAQPVAGSGEIAYSWHVSPGVDRFRYQASDSEGLASTAEVRVAVVDFSATGWQNPENPADVDLDGQVFPRDALLAISLINQGVEELGEEADAGFSTMPLVDVSGNGRLSALDALMIITALEAPQGEGESQVLKAATASRTILPGETNRPNVEGESLRENPPRAAHWAGFEPTDVEPADVLLPPSIDFLLDRPLARSEEPSEDELIGLLAADILRNDSL